MKQTNNAIKFLVAQYRAIFKNAYFKGITTAALLTAGLATGSAQAATPITQDNFADQAGVDGVVTITDDNLLQISGSATSEKAVTFDITAGSGDDAGNNITGAAGDLKVEAKKATLKINGAQGTVGLLVKAGGKGAVSAEFADINVLGGDLNIDAASAAATLTAKNISIGGDAAKNAQLTFTGKSGALGTKSSASDLGSVVILKDKSKVVVDGAAAAAGTINASTLTMDGGEIAVTGAANEAGLTLELDGGSIAGGTIKVAGGTGAGKLNITFNAANANASKTLTVAEAAQITVGKSGSLSISGGKLVAGSASFVAPADAKDAGSLFVESGAVFVTDSAVAGKVGVSVSGNATLDFGQEEVDLTKLKFGAAASAETKTVALADGTSKVKAKSFTLAEDIGQSGNLVAETITTTAAIAKLDSGSFTVSKALVLGGDLTATNAKAITLNSADSGSITGSNLTKGITLSGSAITVEKGAWTSDVPLVIGDAASSGSLAVGSASGTSSLTLTGKFSLASGSATVGGASQSGSTLDLTGATLDLSGGALKAEANGTLMLKGADASKLEKVQTTVAASGTLSFSGDDATLDLSKLKEAPTSAGEIGVAGTLKSDGTLTLSGDKVEVAGTGVLQGKTVKFTGGSAAYNLSGGTVIAESALTADKAMNVSGGKLQLGVTGTESGSVTGAIDVKSSTATVAFGNWTAGDVTLSSDAIANATLTIDKGASLTATKLDATKGTVAVNGSATVNGLTTGENADAALNVSGTLTINGTDDASKNGLDLKANTVHVGTTGNVVIAGNALKQVSTTSTSGAGIVKGAIELKEGSTLTLSFDSSKTLDTTAIDNIRQNLVKDAQAGQAGLGFINVGDAKITDVTVTDGKVSWDDAQKVADINATQNELAQATVTGIGSGVDVKGSFGAFQTAAGNADTSVGIKDSTILQNAAGNGGKFASNASGDTLGLDIKAGTTQLKNGGEVGTVTLTDSKATLIVSSGEGQTTIKSIAGTGASGGDVTLDGATSVTESVLAKDLTVNSGKTTVGTTLTTSGKLAVKEGAATEVKGNVSIADTSDIAGSLAVTSGNAVFTKATTLADTGSIVVSGTASFATGSVFKGTTTVGGDTTLAGDSDIQNDFTVTGKDKTLTFDATTAANVAITKGATVMADIIKVSGTNAGTSTINIGAEGESGSAGSLLAGRLELGGATLIVDPDFTKENSLVGLDSVGAANAITPEKGNAAGTTDGNIAVLQNAVVAIGVDHTTAESTIKNVFADYFDAADGSLDENKAGAILYVAKALNVANGNKLVVDNITSTQYQANTYTDALNIGAKGVLAVSAEAASATKKVGTDTVSRAAIEFEAASATIKADDGATVLLTGDFAVGQKLNLFNDGTGDGVDITGGPNAKLNVTSLNGIFSTVLSGSGVGMGVELKADYAKLTSNFNDGSTPAHDTVVKYALGYAQYNAETGAVVADSQLHGAEVAGVKYENGKFVNADGTDVADASNLMYIKTGENNGTPVYTVYEKAYNAFLNKIASAGNSAKDIDTLTRAGAFSGVAHATVAAGSFTAGAIGARFGLGSTPANVTTASNNVGGALFVAPVYASMDSDGFSAQGTNYGVDVDLYGAAIGADFELAPGFRSGIVLNFGKGDTEGNGAAAGAKDEFDYFGVGLFAGYSVGALSIVADINYTSVSNDLELNFATIGKYKTSLDSYNLNLGVGAQYAMDFNGLAVVPHAGVRFTRVEADDYSVAGVGSYLGDKVGVVSIPVGVTVASAFSADSWTIKPMFDLTLTSNLGEDELQGKFEWEGVNLETNVATEILDNFCYGATAGVAVESGNFAGALGVNYTGSSNSDSYAVSVSARYLF